MDLEKAIAEFERDHRDFSASDRHTIQQIATEIGATNFEIASNGHYFRDVADVAHIHPTMIVLSRRVRLSTERGVYKKWPHHVGLSRWRERSRR